MFRLGAILAEIGRGDTFTRSPSVDDLSIIGVFLRSLTFCRARLGFAKLPTSELRPGTSRAFKSVPLSLGTSRAFKSVHLSLEARILSFSPDLHPIPYLERKPGFQNPNECFRRFTVILPAEGEATTKEGIEQNAHGPDICAKACKRGSSGFAKVGCARKLAKKVVKLAPFARTGLAKTSLRSAQHPPIK